MRIAILTFDGFNELDSLIALGLLNRVKKPGWEVSLCCPTDPVRSMNGVTVQAQSLLPYARSADAVLVGSGVKTREVVQDAALMAELDFDPARIFDPNGRGIAMARQVAFGSLEYRGCGNTVVATVAAGLAA